MGLFQIDDNSSAPNQAVIEVYRGRNGSVANPIYPDPCPVTWKSLTPLAFNIPDDLWDVELGTEVFNRSWLGNHGYLDFYYVDSNQNRVNVFPFYEPFFTYDIFNSDGDCEIFRSGSRRMQAGLCNWTQLTWIVS